MLESLALKLRVLRAERGWTLNQAAERAGVQPETISDAEHGKRRPYTPTLTKIAKGYGVPVEKLLEEPLLVGRADAPEAGRSKAETEWSEYKEVKDRDERSYWELARGFLARTPSDAKRIEDLTRAAGILEGYVGRWAAELACLTERGEYPYGKGIETDNLYQRIATALETSHFLPYALWVNNERSEEVSPSELAASKRLLEAFKNMGDFVERTQQTERQMRPDRGEVEQGLTELQRILARESAG
jgi:transcriptional regulator with XRE-family HTH domain